MLGGSVRQLGLWEVAEVYGAINSVGLYLGPMFQAGGLRLAERG